MKLVNLIISAFFAGNVIATNAPETSFSFYLAMTYSLVSMLCCLVNVIQIKAAESNSGELLGRNKTSDSRFWMWNGALNLATIVLGVIL